MLFILIIDIINTIVSSIIKLLAAIDSIKEVAVLFSLLLIIIIGSFFYQLLISNELIELITEPRIERIGGFCYQQRIRPNVRIVGIQFPLNDDAVLLGATQKVTAYVIMTPEIKRKTFYDLCESLENAILDPRSELLLLRANPEWKYKLQDFYNHLDVHPDDPKLLKVE